MRILLLTFIVGFFICGQGLAGQVQIVAATAQQKGESWSFAVTLKHADSGWDHYADAWRVVSAEGEVLGTRTLFHPHENEQPFTRSLDSVKVPVPAKPVYIEAHDKVHGWSDQRFEVRLNSH